jgi:hypothetical protein
VARDDAETIIHRLVVGDEVAVAAIVAAARTSDDPIVLVAAALFEAAPHDLLERAAACATTARDRQVVAIATAHLAGEDDRVDELARDHLVDHPDSVLVAWIAADRARNRARKDPS